MATHCSVLAWRIPGTAEPGGLPSMMNVFGFLYPEHFGHYVRRLKVLLKIFILAGSHLV